MLDPMTNVLNSEYIVQGSTWNLELQAMYSEYMQALL